MYENCKHLFQMTLKIVLTQCEKESNFLLEWSRIQSQFLPSKKTAALAVIRGGKLILLYEPNEELNCLVAKVFIT